ncbi:Xylanase inhibitor, C-terminal [Sesbania bispinosa]|nr:Xylanase inhibitor, C-terminal [Sesbania bispinosa]
MPKISHYSSLALCLCFISLIEALNNGFSVELIHRDSPRSPFYQPTQTHFQRVANAVRRSINRANHFNKQFVSTKTIEINVIPDEEIEYLMSYSIGTPPFEIFGVVDTGSDIVWSQCEPCKACYKQITPIFDPSKSPTYKIFPCSSTTCQSNRVDNCSSNYEQNCEYTIEYNDGSHSKGDLSEDTLTLGSTDGYPVSFPNFVIGCGHDNIGTFRGRFSGIVGLGDGPLSLINQLSSSISGKFSYCLVPLFPETNTSSKLNFGESALVSGYGTVSTPIVPTSRKIFYTLTLEAFSVGNNRIELGNFSGDGNIIIDSGTTVTLLPGDVYSKLESAVIDVVKLERVEDPNKEFNLCYNTTSEELEVPIITTHFKGADVQLNALNTFLPIQNGIVCFAFASSQIGAIFGNWAQQNFLIGYDLQRKTVSFKPTDCTKQ